MRVRYIVNSIFNSRTYVLTSENDSEVWLVDVGDLDPLLPMIGNRTLKGVLLSHIHYDHIYGLPELLRRFPDMMVFTNDFGRFALADDRVNMSKYHEDPINLISDRIAVCVDGARISLTEGLEAVVHHTPGHNPSCLTYEIGDYLFTGDSYIPGVAVVTTLPNADKSVAAESVLRIQALAKNKTVFPGHEIL